MAAAATLAATATPPTGAHQRAASAREDDSREGGLTGSANRNLGDYFQIAYDPQGAAVVSFADDHNDLDGNTYVTRQLDGTGLLATANGGTGLVNTVSASGPPLYSFADPEVVDPVHDALVELQPVPTDDPFDIVSIKYFADNLGPNAPYVGARMTLSGLTHVPPPGSWRMAFTANAPFATNQLPYGDSDHGDMFFIQAIDSAATTSFRYGTGYRDSASATAPYSMAYHDMGAADSGYVDTTTSTVTVKVALSKLNALLPAGHAPIAIGTWLSGLRGTAGATGSGSHDSTRGGRFNYLVNVTGYTGVGDLSGGARIALASAPNPALRGTTVRYALPARSAISLDLYDVRGRLVRTLQSGVFAAGAHEAFWDGRAAGGARAGAGVYFARLTVGERPVAQQRIVLVW